MNDNTFVYSSDPVVGYSEGIIKASDPKIEGMERPTRIDNNDWIIIGQFRFNVHPFRLDLGGYPVRWIERESGGYVRPQDVKQYDNVGKEEECEDI